MTKDLFTFCCQMLNWVFLLIDVPLVGCAVMGCYSVHSLPRCCRRPAVGGHHSCCVVGALCPTLGPLRRFGDQFPVFCSLQHASLSLWWWGPILGRLGLLESPFSGYPPLGHRLVQQTGSRLWWGVVFAFLKVPHCCHSVRASCQPTLQLCAH